MYCITCRRRHARARKRVPGWANNRATSFMETTSAISEREWVLLDSCFTVTEQMLTGLKKSLIIHHTLPQQ
jgi:hypothetical protein